MATVQSLVQGYGEGFPTIEELFGLEPDEEWLLRMSEPTPALARYFRSVAEFRDITSQRTVGLVRFRVLVERFIALSELMDSYTGVHSARRIVHSLTFQDKALLRKLACSPADVFRAETIERFTEHDTAAAGDYLKLYIGRQFPHLEQFIEGVAFADTSEDTMGPTFGLILNKLVFGAFLPKLLDFMARLLDYVDMLEKNEPLILPALTHEQAAEPTTFGKKVVTGLKSVDYHIRRLIEGSHFTPFTGKLGGATGNMATHFAAYPDIDWRGFARRYVEGLGLTYDELSFQAATYDLEVSHFTEIAHMLTHIEKVVDDFVKMASCPAQLFVKRKKKETKGSSIMPNKSNAWGMEGALEMLREARAMLFHLVQTLPVYPHEGNMGRSYLLRNIGTVFMPILIALSRISGEMVGDMVYRGYAPNPAKIEAFFNEYPGMAGSSVQTILKRAGIEGDAYREIEGIAINRDGTYANAKQFKAGLEKVMERNGLSEEVRAELRRLMDPARNIGDADTLAKKYGAGLRERIGTYREMLRSYAAPLITTEG